MTGEESRFYCLVVVVVCFHDQSALKRGDPRKSLSIEVATK